MKRAELEKAVRVLLKEPLVDEELRARLEALSVEREFPGLTWLWGPELYRRNRVLFRPFILNRFGTTTSTFTSGWKEVAWKGDAERDLERWLAAVDEADDVELFRRLYQWKIRTTVGWRGASAAIREETLKRFKAAGSEASRQIVLAKLDLWFELDEPGALALYSVDSKSGPFILKHLPWNWSWTGEKRKLWEKLIAEALARGDSKLAWSLYRLQVPAERWEKDTEELARSVTDGAELCRRLEERHPSDLDAGKGFARLLASRGRDVMPYVLRHVVDVRQRFLLRGSYGRLIDLAREKDWLDLWSALVRTCGTVNDFNKEVRGLAENRTLPEEEVLGRLSALAGVSREWNWPGLGLAQVHLLDEATALALYERFPNLVRGPFKLHLQPTWGKAYTKVIDRFLAAREEDLVDLLASRLATRVAYWGQGKMTDEAERLADYYDRLKQDEASFSRRAASVLSQIPAYSIWHPLYNRLIRENRLARLLFERSAPAYLADTRAMQDLIEASEIHVQALAYRALGLDDDRARDIASKNLTLLTGTLFRPMQRDTRRLAFRALSNGATTRENAKLILERAREALELPDKRYPKEQLLGLIARLLHRWPELRSERERPRVYDRVPA